MGSKSYPIYNDKPIRADRDGYYYYDPSNPISLKFSLNLYHKPYKVDNSDTSTSNTPKIDKGDIKLIESILDWQSAN